MEKVACGFSKTAHKEVFVSLTMNLDEIGPYCTGLGILRSTIADGVAMPSVRLDLSHGAVGEMADMYSCTHCILNCLFPDKSADDWKDVVKKITTQIKRLKSKKKAKLGEYLVQKVTVSTDSVEAEGEGENMADNSVQCNLLGKQNAALQKEVQRLRDENVKLKEKLRRARKPVQPLVVDPGWQRNEDVEPPRIHAFKEPTGPAELLHSNATPLTFLKHVLGADSFVNLAEASNLNAVAKSPPAEIDPAEA